MGLLLGGCGSAYISPSISAQNAQLPLTVIKLTAPVVQTANAANGYAPRPLPTAFQQTAGTGGGLTGDAAPPQGFIGEQVAPTQPVLRIPPPIAPTPYVIGVGDVLVLATRQGGSTVEELTGLLAAQNRRQGYTVQDDGAIAIPDVGRIELAGLTLEEAESRVFQRLVERQIDPTFSLEVSEFNSKRVSIGGAVTNPSVVPIKLTPLYLDEALAAAGGVSATDLDFVTVRIYRDGALYQIPLNELFSNRALQRIALVEGDSVFVDTTFELDRAQAYFEQQIVLAEFRQQGQAQALARLNAEVAIRRGELDEQRSNFDRRLALDAVDRDYVFLTGEVTAQGRFPLPFETRATLADALFDGGGFPNETGNPSQIYVLRANNAGAVTALHLDGSNVVNMVLATRLELQPDDIIFVAEQPITRWNRVVQQFVPSLITTGVAAATN